MIFMGECALKIDKKSLLYGTAVLTAANIFVRLLGFIYRIFLSRTIGPQGIGISQLIFPLFMIAISITSSGLSIAVSRLVAQRNAERDYAGIKMVVTASSFIVFILSVIVSLLIYMNSNFIISHILREERVRIGLYIITPCILISGLGSVLKGYFYGLKNVHPSALAEIVEQIVRMFLVFSLLIYIPNKSDEISAAIIVFGMVIGELASMLYLSHTYKNSVGNARAFSKKNKHSLTETFGQILSIAVPVSITRIVMSLLNAANSILIPRQLMASGMTNHEAVGIYGIVTGMVMPLLFLPFTIISSLSVMIIPNISENMTIKNYTDIKIKIYKSIRISSITAFFFMGILIPFGYPIGMILYNQPLVGKYIIPLASVLIFQCLQHNLSSILNGLGKQNIAALNIIIGGFIQTGCTYYLACKPEWGIKGYILGYILSTITVFLLNFIHVIMTINIRFEINKCFIQPALISLFMGLAMRLLYIFLVHSHITYGIALVICLLCGFIIEVLFLMQTGVSQVHIFRAGRKQSIYNRTI